MAFPASKRLKKELDALKNKENIDESIDLRVSPDSMLQWTATIIAPAGSFYEGYSFDLEITASQQYPMVPPTIVFKTKIFHPNVMFKTGEICLDILKKEWSPAWSLQSACRAIMALLESPAADSPLNCDAGNILRANDTIAFKSMNYLSHLTTTTNTLDVNIHNHRFEIKQLQYSISKNEPRSRRFRPVSLIYQLLICNLTYPEWMWFLSQEYESSTTMTTNLLKEFEQSTRINISRLLVFLQDKCCQR